MKNLLLSLMVLAMIAIVAILAYLLLQMNPEQTSVLDPATLPPNGLHVSSYIVDETNNIVRVEIITNIAQDAAGFDLSLGYNPDILTPIESETGTPALIGDLFANASPVRNLINTDSANHSIRMMYVFFGQEESASGSGTLAVMEFEISADTGSAVIELQDARLSTVNDAGVAEYIDLNIGDPRISLLRDESGTVQTISGFAPRMNLMPFIMAIIALSSFLGISLIVYVVMLLKSRQALNPHQRRS